MAKTHGTAPRTLPADLLAALAKRGFRAAARPNFPDLWRLTSHPDVFIEVVPSNVPGDLSVVARWGVRNHFAPHSGMMSSDELLNRLDAMMAQYQHALEMAR